jgi:hypothetical protein
VKNTTTILSSDTLTPERPPLKVMEDYWTYPHSDVLWLEFSSGGPVGPVAVYSYFQEVNASAEANIFRGMDYYINNYYIDSFNTSAQPYEIRSCLLDIPEVKFNMTLKKATWSQLKPILNAIEVYQVGNWNDTSTALEDGQFQLCSVFD